MTSVDLSGDGIPELSVYLLAAEEDREFCAKIRKHLKPLTLNDEVAIRVEDDFSAAAGDGLEAQRAKVLDADVVLSLVSADFIDDDEIYHRNQQVIERYNRREALLMSVLVRSCMWQLTPLAKVPVLPSNEQPIANRRAWSSEDAAITAVIDELHESLSDLAELEVVETGATLDLRETPVAATASDEVLIEERAAAEPAVDDAIAAPTTPGPAEASRSVALKVTVAEHEPVEPEWRATFYRQVMWRRFGAVFVDSFIGLLAVALLLAPFGATAEESDTPLFVSYAVVFLLLMPLMESRWRTTPGKYLFGLQVTDRHGQAISFGRAFVRSFAKYVVNYLYVLVIPLIIQLRRFRTTRKLFHDEMTGTLISRR